MYCFLEKGRYIYLNRIKNFLTGLTHPRRLRLRKEKKERVGPKEWAGESRGVKFPQVVENLPKVVENS